MTDNLNADAQPMEEQVLGGPSAENSTNEEVLDKALEQNENEGNTENASDTDENVAAQYLTEQEVVDRLKVLAEEDEKISRKEIDVLKSVFYKLQKAANEEAYKAYIDNNGNPEEYMPADDPLEVEFKDVFAKVKEKRNEQNQEDERLREENYQSKLSIIDSIKAILESPEEINKKYPDFKALQQKWNEIKEVPAEKASELWKSYQHAVEQFYDTLKLNNEFRAYDFKKNLELKTALCEKAEKLDEVTDVVSAFRQLQDLHEQFREIGPVESAKREEIWNRFKAASTVINKKHQAFFEERKKQEEDNLAKKTEICEIIEGKDTSSLVSFADWNAMTKEITDLQAKWKTIGFAPQKMNVKIYERYRAACDKFFTLKAEFFKNVKDSLNQNLEKKTALCEKAEALKDSTDWKATSDLIKQLQKEWKTIGAVPKKVSDAVWKRFTSACDAFFDAKNAANSSQYAEQNENLEKKQAIIQKLKDIIPEETKEDVRNLVRALQDEWNAIGHVPFKEKDKIYDAYREQLDRLYKFASSQASKRRVQKFKSELRDDNNGGLRSRLIRERDIVSNEIKTYENNLGFLNISSKSSNSIVEEINRKIEKLKNDLNEIKEKIKALDEKNED